MKVGDGRERQRLANWRCSGNGAEMERRSGAACVMAASVFLDPVQVRLSGNSVPTNNRPKGEVVFLMGDTERCVKSRDFAPKKLGVSLHFD